MARRFARVPCSCAVCVEPPQRFGFWRDMLGRAKNSTLSASEKQLEISCELEIWPNLGTVRFVLILTHPRFDAVRLFPYEYRQGCVCVEQTPAR